MKTYKDLIIDLKGADKLEFANQAKAEDNPLWERQYDKEENADIWAISFLYKGMPQAGLWIMEKSKGTLYISNIIPKEKSELSYDEYNTITDKFNEDVIKPIIDRLDIAITITKGYYELNDYLNEWNQKLFLSFSNLANKSTKSSHPLDRNRWYQFIISSFRAHQILPTDILEGFLIENGWIEDNVVDLLIEYEFAIGLLSEYEQTR